MTHNTLFSSVIPTIETIKRLGLEKSDSNLDILIEFFMRDEISIDAKREITSSIGRQINNDKIYDFLNKEVFKNHYMEVIYQMFRTTLYKAKKDIRFMELRDRILKYYQNEVMQKMFEYYTFRQEKKQNKKSLTQILKPSLLIGDNCQTLKKYKNSKFN